MTLSPEDLYRQRFAGTNQQTRLALWRVLCDDCLQRYVAPADTVVDLGAGFCEFINTIRCRSKIAVDTNPAVRQHAASDVRVVAGDIPAALKEVESGTADVVFSSNFLEHLRDKTAVLAVLREAHRLLVAGGRVIIIQPNIRYAYKEYWDFFDHHVALSDASISEALQLVGFHIDEMRPRFLPYTTKSRVPQTAALLRFYLRCPPLQWLFGKQMLVVARK